MKHLAVGLFAVGGLLWILAIIGSIANLSSLYSVTGSSVCQSDKPNTRCIQAGNQAIHVFSRRKIILGITGGVGTLTMIGGGFAYAKASKAKHPSVRD